MPLKLYQRSKLVQTAAASKSVPSVNFTPLRSEKVQVLPSVLVSHFSARAGTMSVPPSLVVTRPSKICRSTRIDSPSLTYAPSRIAGSAEAPNTRVPDAGATLAPPDAEPDPDGVLLLEPPPQAARVRANTPPTAPTTIRACRFGGRRVAICCLVSFVVPSRTGRRNHRLCRTVATDGARRQVRPTTPWLQSGHDAHIIRREELWPKGLGHPGGLPMDCSCRPPPRAVAPRPPLSAAESPSDTCAVPPAPFTP